MEFTYENQFIAWQVVDCLHSDKQTTVEIDKRAFTSDSDNTFTDGTPHYIERIPMGTYTLTETMAPIEQGYVRAESVTLEVGPTGDIQRVEMKDDFTKVEISKADMTDAASCLVQS